MLSKNNNRELQRKIDDRQERFALRKLSVGVASVLLGSFIMGTQLSQNAYASDNNATKEVTETTPPTNLETSNISLNQVTSTSAVASASDNANSQVSPASDKTLVASSESPVSSVAEPASNNQASAVVATNNNSGSAEVLAATSGAIQTPTPAPTSSGYSVAMPAPSYATGYNESNVPLDPNTAHQTVQSFIVASSVDNPGENAQKGLNNLYAYSISQADVNGTGLPSQFYFMKFNSDGTLAKTVVIPTDAPGGSVYKIDDYAQITVIKFQNQPASFQLGKQIDDTNRFMPIYNAFNNQVGQGAWGSAPEIPVPSWTTQTTTYKDQNGNVIRPPYTQYGWTMSDFTTEPVQVPGYDVRATPNYVEGQYDNNIPASQKNGQITQGTVYQQGDEIDTVQVGSKRTVYVQAKIIDDKGTVQIRSWMTYAKEAGTFDPNSSNANDKGRTAAVLPPADYDFETNPNGYKIYNNSDMVVGGGAVGNQQQAARNQAGFNGQVAFQQVRFVYTNPAEQTPPAIGDNARNNAPIDTIIYPNDKEYPDGGYPAGSVRYANAQDYVILPYGTFTWGGYDTASSVTITNPVVFPSDVNYVYWTQTATITYIDDTTGKVLQTDNINGQINSTSKYSPTNAQYSGSSTIGYDNPRTTKTIGDYEKEGYVLVSNNFPTNGVVFNTPNTPQSYEIHFVEGAQEITPNTPADQVPTGTPDDAQPSALSKEVTLTVNYVNSDSTKFTGTIPANADQSVNFTGTAYVSKVTGQLVNTTTQNGQLVVDPSNKNTPEITWTPTSGSFNEVVSPVESGYYLKSISSNQNGNNVGPISNITPTSGNVTVTVTYAPLGHIIPVGPDGKPIPGAPQPQFPNNPNNPAEGNPGNKPDVPNWTPTEPGTTVSPNPNDPGANVNVPYTQNEVTGTVTYINDTTGKTLSTADLPKGTVGSAINYSPVDTIAQYEKDGYVLVSNNYPANPVYKATDNNYQVHFVEGAQEITPNTPADQVPTGTPDDAQPSALSKEVTLKVNYVNSDGTKFKGTIPANADQNVNFTGTAYVSKVTGQLVNTTTQNGQLVVDPSNKDTPEITWTPTSGSFNEVVSPVESGYYLKSISSNQNGNNVGPITGLTHNSNDVTVTVTYAPLGHIIPVGPDGKPIPGAPQPQFPNNPNNPAEGNPGTKPDVPNWTPTEPGTTVSPNPNDPGANVEVPYTQDQGSITVTVHDMTDNVNLPQYGKSSGEQDVGTGFTYDKNTVITDLENKGYKVLNPDVVIPTTISKGAQNIVINVEHQLVPVTPENPGTPGQPINPNDPNGPKWPDGTAKDDLEVTGSQTIHYEGAGDKTPADNTQHFTFTKSATVDKVTGKIVSETGWNVASHTFGNVDTPVVAGYHADKAVAGGATITPDDLNKTIVVTYAPNGHVIPVGPDGTPIPGADQPQFPTNPDNPTGTTPSEVPVVPGYHPETGKPGDPVDPVPGQPGENVPVKYVPDTPTPETYTGSQTIKFVDGNGTELHAPNIQTATDLTGDHTFGQINVPVIKGYTTTQTTAGGATVTKDNPDAVITVTYTPNGKIIPVGPDGKPIPDAPTPQFPTNPDNPGETTPGQVPDVPGYHPESGKPGDPVDPVPGKPGEDVPVKYVPDNPTPETYTGSQTIKFVDGTTGKEIETPNVQTATDLTGDHTFGQINVPVIKGYTTTQTTAGGATVTKDNPDAVITVTYTPNGKIIPVGPDGKPIPDAPTPQFPTNPDNPGETTPGQVPDVPGYHPESGKPGDPVDPVPGKPGEDVPVKYVPDTPVEQGSITVTVRDTTDNVDLPQYGKSSGEQDVGTTFTYDKDTVIQELENKGYKVLNPDVVIPTTIGKGAQNIVINVEHQLVPVTPENPGQPGQPINPDDPDGPKWPNGTAKDDLEATGTQTIHYVGAGDQTPADNVQHFTFTKSAVVDKVTGKVVSETGWNVASHTFGNVDTPVVPGYHADKAVAGGTTITPDDLNTTVTVTYTPNGHIIPVGPDGKPLPNVPQPQYPTKPNNPTEVMPNEPVPEIPGYTPNISTVTPENPGENTPVVYTPNENPVGPTTPGDNGNTNGNTGNPTTPEPETPAGNGNGPVNGQTTSPAGGPVTTNNLNTANANSSAAKQASQLPQTGNEQLKHEGILGLLALGFAGLLAFGKKRRKE